jgi:hypothetical protein
VDKRDGVRDVYVFICTIVYHYRRKGRLLLVATVSRLIKQMATGYGESDTDNEFARPGMSVLLRPGFLWCTLSLVIDRKIFPLRICAAFPPFLCILLSTPCLWTYMMFRLAAESPRVIPTLLYVSLLPIKRARSQPRSAPSTID